MPIDSRTSDKATDLPLEIPSLLERGIYTIVLLYHMRDQATDALNTRGVMIPTDYKILPELRSMYREMLELGPTIRKRAGKDGRFFLVDRQLNIAGYIRLDLKNLSDHDLAWLTCFLAETENAVPMELCAEEEMAS